MKATMMPTRGFEPAFDPDKDPFDPERVGLPERDLGHAVYREWGVSGGWNILIGGPAETAMTIFRPLGQASSLSLYNGRRLTHSTALAILRANGFREEGV